MSTKPLVVEKVIDAPIDRVWKAITDKNDMKQWYFDLRDFKAEVGFEFQFEGGSEEKTYVHLCKVTEVIPKKKLTYSWRYRDYEGNSFVTFELSDHKGKTKLRLTHTGLETFPPLEDFGKASFTAGWNEIIGVLLPAFVEMATLRMTETISASPDAVWNVILHGADFWANAFSHGAYVESDWKVGSSVAWKDAGGNVGAKGIVVINNPSQLLKIDFFDDLKASLSDTPGAYSEIFILQKAGDGTKLTAYSGPLSVKDSKVHSPLWQKAIQMIKQKAEKSQTVSGV